MKYVKFSILIITAAAALGFYYVNKPKKSLASTKPDYALAPDELLVAFQSDENAANAKFLDKVIEVKGKVSSVITDKDENITVLIETQDMISSISCQLDNNELENSLKLKTGDVVRIKGNCTGMLMDVVLVSCIIEN